MKKYILLTLALAACLAGCKKEPDYGDAVFMTGTLTTPTIQFNIEGEQSIGLTVSSSASGGRALSWLTPFTNISNLNTALLADEAVTCTRCCVGQHVS